VIQSSTSIVVVGAWAVIAALSQRALGALEGADLDDHARDVLAALATAATQRSV